MGAAGAGGNVRWRQDASSSAAAAAMPSCAQGRLARSAPEVVVALQHLQQEAQVQVPARAGSGRRPSDQWAAAAVAAAEGRAAPWPGLGSGSSPQHAAAALGCAGRAGGRPVPYCPRVPAGGAGRAGEGTTTPAPRPHLGLPRRLVNPALVVSHAERTAARNPAMAYACVGVLGETRRSNQGRRGASRRMEANRRRRRRRCPRCVCSVGHEGRLGQHEKQWPGLLSFNTKNGGVPHLPRGPAAWHPVPAALRAQPARVVLLCRPG